MRLIHIIDNLTPGGTEKQCLALVRGLSQKGVQNAVFYYRSGSLLRELEQLGVTLKKLPQESFRSPSFPFRLTVLVQAIRRWSPDVVQGYGFYSNLPALLGAYLARVPIRIAGRREYGNYLHSSQRRVDTMLWRLANRVVVNSEALRKHLLATERVSPSKVVVIRNGVQIAQSPPCEAASQYDGNVVGMVAHFREQKDHETFLRAAVRVLEVVPSARFSLIGFGSLEGAIRKIADQLGIINQTEFLGNLEGDLLAAAVRRFRVSVLTSKDNEGLPNALLESMALSRPVVATAVGGVPEVVENGATGFLVPPGDTVALAERIVLLLKEPSIARKMGEQGRQKVEREFSMDTMVRQFCQLYEGLIGAKES